MSTEEQMRDNIRTAQAAQPLSAEETDALWAAMEIYRQGAPVTPRDLPAFRGILWNGVPVTAILQAYAICQIQPNPGFSDDNNYFKNALAAAAHLDLKGDLPHPPVVLPNGDDKTELVDKAVAWLAAHSF